MNKGKSSHGDSKYKNEKHLEKNKIRRILKQLKDHPLTMNNAPMMERLEQLKKVV